MANRAKQQRERRRQNARDGVRNTMSHHEVFRLTVEDVVKHWRKMETPFLDALRSRDERLCVGMRSPVLLGRSRVAETMEIQQRLNQVVKFTTQYVSMSSSLPERDRRIAEITHGHIGELRQRLEEDMMKALLGELPAYLRGQS